MQSSYISTAGLEIAIQVNNGFIQFNENGIQKQINVEDLDSINKHGVIQGDYILHGKYKLKRLYLKQINIMLCRLFKTFTSTQILNGVEFQEINLVNAPIVHEGSLSYFKVPGLIYCKVNGKFATFTREFVEVMNIMPSLYFKEVTEDNQKWIDEYAFETKIGSMYKLNDKLYIDGQEFAGYKELLSKFND